MVQFILNKIMALTRFELKIPHSITILDIGVELSRSYSRLLGLLL